MAEMLISIGSDVASDSWGFVGVVRVGEYEAYRTIKSFATPSEAESETQAIVGGVLGELLAGAEWRWLREKLGSAPTRRDLALGVLQPRPDQHAQG